jgi:dinuclear metal center YbgI/SA1388 family protein
MGPAVPVADIADYANQLLDVTLVDDTEGNGLVQPTRKPVAKIGAAVNTSFEAVERATELGVDLLLVHHTSWREMDLGLRDQKFELLGRRGIGLYAAHESLDYAREIGPADTLAQMLSLRTEERILGGAGVVGCFADTTLSALVARAERVLGGRVVVHAHNPRFVRGAIAPGGAGLTGHLEEAYRHGCDTYLTGEGCMYTDLFAQEVGLNLIFAGHYRTELPAIQALTRRVADHFGLAWVTVPDHWHEP